MKSTHLLVLWLTISISESTLFSKQAQSRVGQNGAFKEKTDPGACPIHPTPQPLPTPLPDIINEAINNLTILTESLPSTTPGVAVGVTYQGKLLLSKGFGVKDKNKPDPPDADTIFRIGSISKVFVVLTLFQLLDQGKVKSLDDPLTDYCPQFSIKNSYKTEDVITLRMLASQMSGIPYNPPCYYPNNTGANYTLCGEENTEDILKRLSQQYLVEPSWTRPSYSNLAYALLGRCLTEKFGLTFEDYVQNEILAPLNMTSTGFNYTNSVVSRMATGYSSDGSEAPLVDLGWAAPAGQMYSTVNDLLKLGQFFVTNGEYGGILRPDLVKEMGLPAFLDYDGITVFGTPWEMVFLESYLIRSKGGEVTGYLGYFSYLPDLQISLVVLMNSDTAQAGVIATPYSILIPTFVKVLLFLQPNYPAPPDLKVYIGPYYSDVLKSNITIIPYENMLGIQFSPTFAAYLSFYDDLLFQIKFPDGLLRCVIYEIVSMNNEWVYFEPVDSSGRSPGFTLPGVYGLNRLTRVD